MQFNSYIFIFLCLPVTVCLYFAANRFRAGAGRLVLILSGIWFYSLGRMNMLGYLLFSIFINYAAAFLIRKKALSAKAVEIVTVIINICILIYFKYFNFILSNINVLSGTSFAMKEMILPLGISFYTFQQISWIVSVSKGELDHAGLIDYLAYILYFPKLIMGPLIEPKNFISQLHDPDRMTFSADHLASGIRLFSYGLLKKVLLADTFARASGWVYGNLETATSMDCVLLILFYTFEIYFDFSGYSDMAVGISEMINIDLPANFDSPYKALSIRDFWKRWHMSLTMFLTRYIYIPLGGSRKGRMMTYVNTMIVFLISGLWHGANWTFVLWGFLHGLLSCLDRIFEKQEEKVFVPVRWMITMTAVSILWLLFSAESVSQWRQILVKIIEMKNLNISAGLISNFRIGESTFLISLFHLEKADARIRGFGMLVFILVSSAVCLIPENGYRTRAKLNPFSFVLAAICFVWGVLCLGAESTFVYFGF
ncbi:MAG TPA: membrane-bound O-acyltransferase family protein [Erysipelotrichaceae bacterium]|nr:membrane-bound O-acyltransferase family protein [Erysipelotrichaceae bacterium]